MTVAVVLAAGASRRFGSPKQLALVDGVTLVARATDVLLAARFYATAVVVGAQAAAVRAALGTRPAAILDNPGWGEGIASSIRTAAAWAQGRHADALCIVVCDQPRLSVAHVTALCAARGPDPACVAASGYSGVVGVPAVFGADWYARLQGLEGDRGAGSLLRDAAGLRVLPWPDGALDIDTPADLSASADTRDKRFLTRQSPFHE